MTNIVNEDIIRKILTCDYPNNEIKILKWDINKNIVGTCSNFASEVSRLTVTYEKDHIQIQKAFFMKVPCNSIAYEDFNRSEVYDKEIVMYSKVFPQMYAIDDEYFTPRNYFVDGKKSLFQKDLSLSGYKMMNNMDQLNLEQSLYALKCLAKFHGLSVKVEGAFGFPDVVKRNARCYPKDESKRLEEIDGFYQSIKEFDHSLPNDIKERYAKQVAAFNNITWEQYEHDVSPRYDSFNVLIHGDFWTNNILFKCDKFGILKKVKVVDFQLCAWTNPSIDLIYFMITSVKFEVYEKYFDLLLEVYLDTLNKVLDKLNCRTYRMEELVRDIETRYVYGCYVIIEALPFIICDPEDPIELDNFTVSPFLKIYGQRFYREVAMKWLLHFIQKGVFDGEAVNGGN